MVYKLSYFDIRGFGEYIRLFLVDQGIPFEDHRIQRAEWAEIKNKFQFGQVPCLHDGDNQIVQTGAILRHLARKHGLNGDTEEETTYIDMFFEGLRDVRAKYVKVIYGDYDGLKDDLIKNIYPAEWTKIENLLKTHQGGEQYVAGEKISYADYVLFEELDIALVLDPHALDRFDLLKSFHQRFTNRSSLKAHLDHRAAAHIPINGNGKQ